MLKNNTFLNSYKIAAVRKQVHTHTHTHMLTVAAAINWIQETIKLHRGSVNKEDVAGPFHSIPFSWESLRFD